MSIIVCFSISSELALTVVVPVFEADEDGYKTTVKRSVPSRVIPQVSTS